MINAGSIAATGSNGDGVYFSGTDTLFVSNAATGAISGIYEGIGALVDGTHNTLVNYGTVRGGENGVYMTYFSDLPPVIPVTISNAATAQITGGYNGIFLNGLVGNLSNAGTIQATGVGATERSVGVDLKDGGSVTNATAGVIEGGSGGLRIQGAAGTVINAGFIAGAHGTLANIYGVYLSAGGTVINTPTGNMQAVIYGLQYGVVVAGGTGSIANLGSIYGRGTAGQGVLLHSAGQVTNGNGASIFGTMYSVNLNATGSTLVNYGNVVVGASGAAAVKMGAGDIVRNGPTGAGPARIVGFPVGILANGGTIANGAKGVTGATISGSKVGVSLQAGGGTLTNYGNIYGANTGAYAVAGTIINQGTIAGNGSTGTGVSVAVPRNAYQRHRRHHQRRHVRRGVRGQRRDAGHPRQRRDDRGNRNPRRRRHHERRRDHQRSGRIHRRYL